jgi:hypothetical protein
MFDTGSKAWIEANGLHEDNRDLFETVNRYLDDGNNTFEYGYARGYCARCPRGYRHVLLRVQSSSTGFSCHTCYNKERPRRGIKGQRGGSGGAPLQE